MSRPPAAEPFADLVIETFRLNGRLVNARDRLVSDLGLTSARWQVLGAVKEESLSVAEIARRLRLTRQSVQRIADRLVTDGFLYTATNPAHRRAKLVGLTPHGESIMAEVDRRQAAWASRTAHGIRAKRLTKALRLVRRLADRLEDKRSEEPS